MRAVESEGFFNTLNYLAFKIREIVIHYVAKFDKKSDVEVFGKKQNEEYGLIGNIYILSAKVMNCKE
jgi:hypothetical protein